MYSNFNGENFEDCVYEVADNMGALSVLDRMIKSLDGVLSEKQKWEILNDLWIM